MAASAMVSSFSFSKNGELFTCYADDGILKIWDTSTGSLRQDYTKNLHLSAPCTTLLCFETTKQHGLKRRKYLEAQNVGNYFDNIVLGTTTGTILLYNVSGNKIDDQLEGHTSKVNHLCISKSTNSLYSCSNDRYIIEWDLESHKIRSKWKTPKEKVTCLLALSNGKSLISGSTNIKVWDLEKKIVLKTFTGHSTDVTILMEIPGQDSYFISGAREDRILSTWSLKSNQETSSALASFVLQDGPLCVDLHTTEDVTSIYAITHSGTMHVFKHKLNGLVRKPVKPTHNISIAIESSQAKELSRPLPICGVLTTCAEKVLIAYGSPGLLYFEHFVLTKHKQENIVLLRQDRRRVNGEEFNSRNKVPIVSSDVVYQGPGKVTHKRRSDKQVDLPLEQRLDNLALANMPSVGPKKDNMAQLLVQGLQSKNREILQRVLYLKKDAVIRSTVRHLPIQALPLLLKELVEQAQGKTSITTAAVQWLVEVLRMHSAVLLANPEARVLFEPLLASVETRASLLPSLLRLRGRLGLVMGQMKRGTEEDEERTVEPLINYVEQDSSAEEEDESDPNKNDSDDNWNELSDMEEDDNEADND